MNQIKIALKLKFIKSQYQLPFLILLLPNSFNISIFSFPISIFSFFFYSTGASDFLPWGSWLEPIEFLLTRG